MVSDERKHADGTTRLAITRETTWKLANHVRHRGTDNNVRQNEADDLFDERKLAEIA